MTVGVRMRNGTSLFDALVLKETSIASGVFTATLQHPGRNAEAGASAARITYLDITDDGRVKSVQARVSFASPGHFFLISYTRYGSAIFV